MINRQRINRLQWFLEFLATDLEKISVAKFRKLSAQAATRMTMQAADMKFDNVKPKDKAAKVRKTMLQGMENLYESLSEDQLVKAIGADLFFLQIKLSQAADGVFKTMERVQNGEYSEPLSDGNDIKLGEMAVSRSLSVHIVDDRVSQPESGAKEMSLSPRFQNMEGYEGKPEQIFVYLFMKTLNDIPISDFKRCVECQNWFVATREEKKYCSPRCSGKRNARISRKRKKENDPQAYKKDLKAGRLRAERSYHKRAMEE